jgi:hypothetical protein
MAGERHATCESALRRRSAAARLLRLWVRIPPRAWLSVVSVVCCQAEVTATSLLPVQRSSTDCGASLSVIQNIVNEVALAQCGGGGLSRQIQTNELYLRT